jgi:hypothetical protein
MGSSQSVAVTAPEELPDLDDVTKLPNMMKTLGTQMIAFSMGLRAIYASPNLSNNSVNDMKILEELRLNALKYSIKALPVTSTVVVNLSAYLDNYLDLDFASWESSLKDIVKEVEGYEMACSFLTQMHQALMTALKRQQDDITRSSQLSSHSRQLKDTVACIERLLDSISVLQAYFQLSRGNLEKMVQQANRAANSSGVKERFFRMMKKNAIDCNVKTVCRTLQCTIGEVSKLLMLH